MIAIHGTDPNSRFHPQRQSRRLHWEEYIENGRSDSSRGPTAQGGVACSVASGMRQVMMALLAAAPSGRGSASRHDVIETGADGAVGVTFTDGTAFKLLKDVRMALNEFVSDPSGTSNSA